MTLESYFEFVGQEGQDAIRVKGTRVGLETVVHDYRAGANPEEIVLRYPTLSLEQVHAAIAYFLAHQPEVEAYVARVDRDLDLGWQEQQDHPSPLVQSLRERIEVRRQVLQSAATAIA